MSTETRETVVYPDHGEQTDSSSVTLNQLLKGETGKIVANRSEQLALVLLKMGIVNGDVITITDIAPLGDPIAFKVNGTKISLRKKDASHIWISKM